MVEPAAAHVLALLPAVLGRLGEELVVDVVVLLQRALLRLEGSKKEIKREKETLTLSRMMRGAQLLRW